MVGLCCKKGAAGVPIYPETTSPPTQNHTARSGLGGTSGDHLVQPPLPLVRVAFPPPPAPAGKATQLERVK